MTDQEKPINILINGISARQGGGQTYLFNLLKFLPQNKTLRIYLLLPETFKLPAVSSNIQQFSTARLETNPLLRALWEKWVLPKLLWQWKIDVLYCPGGIINTKLPSACKTATMFQNMLPFAPTERQRYPCGYLRFRLWLLRFLQGRSFQRAHLVIFISSYAKTVMDRCLPQRQGMSAIIPHGLSDHFRAKAPLPFPTNLPQEYVLYVSILDVYKAQLEVVESWKRLRAQRPTAEKLVFIGPSYPPYAKKLKRLIASLGLSQEVLLLGTMPYEELPQYYQHAKINIFASSCENCPNIVLEELASGRPVFLSNYPPMPEFGEDGVEYFDPYKPQELTDLLHQYLDDPVRREKLAQKALLQSQKFQWRESAEKTWHILMNLASK